MNRLDNLNIQLGPSQWSIFINQSKISPIQIKSIVYGPYYKYVQQIYNIIENNLTIFNHPDIQEQTRKVQRYHAARQMLTILKNYKITDMKKDGYKFAFGLYGLITYNLGLAIKSNIQYMLYSKTLQTYGTTKLHNQYLQKALNLQHLGCFALTQIHHGSYTKGIATEAIYNHDKKQFKLTTHGNKGMKFWIGGSSQIANMAVIWAQVIVKGISYGPHPFIVQIRDFKTHDLMPGVIIGDCGDKFGLNGIDNGYFILQGLIVPKQNLLNGLGGIDQNGNYVSKIKSNQRRFGLHMSPLSSGRASLAYSALSCSTNALAIACKYVCDRRQFSNPNDKSGKQLLLIDYPMTKDRLIPLISQTLVYYIGGLFIAKQYIQNTQIFADPQNMLVQQLHGISGVLKCKGTWFSNKVITECRQLLGGHGYSSYSRLGRIYADNEVQSTWQGDNNMLLQQTSKYLLKCVLTKTKCQLINIQFLWQQNDSIVNNKQNKESEIDNIDNLDSLYKIIKSILLSKLVNVRDKMIQLKQMNMSSWDEWNRLQPHYCNGLALSFGDYIYIIKARQVLNKVQNKQTREYLSNSIRIWVMKIILQQKYKTYEYRLKVQQKIIQLCQLMTPDAMKFINIIKPPNFIIDSPFVKQQPIKQYINLLFTAGNQKTSTFQRINWHQQLLQLKNNHL